MSIIIFLIILSVLVFVHELGHFIVAKYSGVEVEEFGFGYPPRALTLGYKWGTRFSLNWIPFGGFVKILGENYEDGGVLLDQQKEEIISKNSLVEGESSSPTRGLFEKQFPISALSKSKKRFIDISRPWQAAILVAGVTFNVVFAWLLISSAFIFGIPTPVDNNLDLKVKNPQITVISVLPNSQAEIAKIKSGDILESVVIDGKFFVLKDTREFVEVIQNYKKDIVLNIVRANQKISVPVVLQVDKEGKKLLGVHLDMVGVAKLPIFDSFISGAKTTFYIVEGTISGIFQMLKGIFIGKADLSQVTGPIGIVGIVGDASKLGISYLLTFTALISINLAVINLLPFPALDGGRLLFVIIESITRKKIPSKVMLYTNTIGFSLLIILMIVVTIKDISKLF